MPSIRRLAYAVFGVACTHLVFGAIVRISGSGMGCGPHWPKCYGRWFPPFDRPDLVIEVMHRYLASILLLSLIALTVAAWRRRGEAGVGGPGGVLRSAGLATALGFGAALLGAVTVKLGNTPAATVAHWTVAMSLVATVAACVVRTGGLGGAAALLGGASAKTRRGTLAAAALALVAVVLGGLTAKVPGGSVACLSFPLCGANPDVARGAVHVQGTHRVIAVLLVLHLVGLFFALRKRNEAAVIRRAASAALGLGVLQLLVAGAMIGMKLPPVLRSLHEATGVSIWIATFVLAYLSRIASAEGRDGAMIGGTVHPPAAPVGMTPGLVTSGRVVVGAPSGHASEAASPRAPASASLSVRLAADAFDTSAARPPVALPAVDPMPLVMAYRPKTPTGSVSAQRPVRVATSGSASPARTQVPESLELPAAIAHAIRAAAEAALGFHRVSGEAVAALAPETQPEEAHAAPDVVTECRADAPDDAVAPTIMTAALAALEAGMAVSPADACVAAGIAPAEERVEPSVRLDAVDDADVEAALEAEQAEAVAAVETFTRGCPPPPAGEVATDPAELVDRPTARITIFDAIAREADAADDDLYNLRGLDVDDAADESDAGEHVPTLDEEFSLDAIEAALEAAVEAVATDLPPTDAGAPAVAAPPGAFPSLASIAARRPAMSHSIAVIVARGADV